MHIKIAYRGTVPSSISGIKSHALNQTPDLHVHPHSLTPSLPQQSRRIKIYTPLDDPYSQCTRSTPIISTYSPAPPYNSHHCIRGRCCGFVGEFLDSRDVSASTISFPDFKTNRRAISCISNDRAFKVNISWIGGCGSGGCKDGGW